MHLHILGICGTFMGGIAALAQAAGHRVTGSDQHVYPPMSDQLRELGIAVWEGYDPAHLNPAPHCVVVGNVIRRGNPLLEAVLDRGLPYLSGPEWLARHILAERWVLAVAGTHGKTTTASMLAHILDAAHLAPGFLIGGVPGNFGRSARLGQAPFFVVEADEYDTAFFDKRAKFVHYRPRTLILNNLEYDHADIYPDLAAIQRQFHHLIRTVPGNGALIVNGEDKALAETLAMGCWTPVIPFGRTDGWHARLLNDDGSDFEVWEGASRRGQVEWPAFGAHNVANALAALLAARHAGVPLEIGCAALATFAGVRRRLEQRGVQAGVTVFDDFAHHPTAIAATVAALRRRIGAARLVAVVELRSNTMRLGTHRAELAGALAEADQVWVVPPSPVGWDVAESLAPLGAKAHVAGDAGALLAGLLPELAAGDQVLVMSNGGFDGFHERLLQALETHS
ncbi:MAG: UDP-N-acetylmuramate:L-alanyl-gamma-D-glutamyl-meso-diaminopimelate ligase [Candidatus Macondimonas sp.]